MSITRFSLPEKVTLRLLKLYFYSGCGQVVYDAGHKAKGLVLQCINGVSSNPRNMLYIIITAVICIIRERFVDAHYFALLV
jgi:hypothetical protein